MTSCSWPLPTPAAVPPAGCGGPAPQKYLGTRWEEGPRGGPKPLWWQSPGWVRMNEGRLECQVGASNERETGGGQGGLMRWEMETGDRRDSRIVGNC